MVFAISDQCFFNGIGNKLDEGARAADQSIRGADLSQRGVGILSAGADQPISPAKNSLDFNRLGICNLNIVNRHKNFDRPGKRAGLQLAHAFQLFFSFSLVVAAPAVLAQQPDGILTNAADVISLSAEQASRSLTVVVTGVVTAADPALNGR